MKPWEISDATAAKLKELVDKYPSGKITFSIKEVAAESGIDAKKIKKMCEDGEIDTYPREKFAQYRIGIIHLAKLLVGEYAGVEKR